MTREEVLKKDIDFVAMKIKSHMSALDTNTLQYLTSKALAEKLGITQAAIRMSIKRGKYKGRLKKCPCGKGWLIRVDQVT